MKHGGVNVSQVMETWNAFASEHGLATVIKLGPKRQRCINARFKEKEFNLQLILAKIAFSSFLKGGNGRGWKADFDFVFGSPNNYLKILEGKYDDKPKTGRYQFDASKYPTLGR